MVFFFTWGALGDILIQFGGSVNDFTNANYQAQVGASEIIAWWGTDSAGHTIVETGDLKDEGPGATLSSVNNSLTLTSVNISSSDTARTNTVTYGRALGINSAGSTTGAVNFNTAAATTWTFDFDEKVTLHQLLFTGFNFAQDIASVTIEGGDTYNITASTDAALASWAGTQTDRVYTFDTPVEIPAGANITVTSQGSNDWGLGGVVVGVSEPVKLQFGGSAADFTNATYQAHVGADEIINWWGGDSAGHEQGETGSLKDKSEGATLTSVDNNIVLTSVSISSSSSSRTNTVTSGRALGINSAGSTGAAAVFSTADATSWTVEFNQDVTLQQLLFTGFGYAQDIASITVEGAGTYQFAGSTETDDALWITGTQDRVYTFDTPVEIPAGTNVTITSMGSNDWGLGGIVVTVRDPILKPVLGILTLGNQVTVTASNLTASVTNTLYSKTNLTDSVWSLAGAGVFGVTETNWVLNATNSASFFRVQGN
jgi:hypothetical protein